MIQGKQVTRMEKVVGTKENLSSAQVPRTSLKASLKVKSHTQKLINRSKKRNIKIDCFLIFRELMMIPNSAINYTNFSKQKKRCKRFLKKYGRTNVNKKSNLKAAHPQENSLAKMLILKKKT